MKKTMISKKGMLVLGLIFVNLFFSWVFAKALPDLIGISLTGDFTTNKNAKGYYDKEDPIDIYQSIYLVFDDTVSIDDLIEDDVNIRYDCENNRGYGVQTIKMDILWRWNIVKVNRWPGYVRTWKSNLDNRDVHKIYFEGYGTKPTPKVQFNTKAQDRKEKPEYCQARVGNINGLCGTVNGKWYVNSNQISDTSNFEKCKIWEIKNYSYDSDTMQASRTCEGIDWWTNMTCSAYVNTKPNQNCSSIGANTSYNSVSKITQTRSSASADWSPELNTSYSTTASTSNCRYKCNTWHEQWSNKSCIKPYNEFTCKDTGLWAITVSNASTSETTLAASYSSAQKVYRRDKPNDEICNADPASICKTTTNPWGCASWLNATGYTSGTDEVWKYVYWYDCKRNGGDNEVVDCSVNCGTQYWLKYTRNWTEQKCRIENNMCSTTIKNSCKAWNLWTTSTDDWWSYWKCKTDGMTENCAICNANYALNSEKKCEKTCNNASGGFPYCFDIIFDV